MKNIIVLFVAVAAVCSAASPEAKGVRLDAIQSTNVWSQIRASGVTAKRSVPTAGGSASIALAQAPGVIEVIDSVRGSVAVTFVAAKDLPRGTTLAFEMILPDGTEVALGVSKYDDPLGAGFSTTVWNGSFPSVWQYGENVFLVGVLLPSGHISAVAGSVLVGGGCCLAGPLDRFDVSADGTMLSVTGLFTDDTYATLNGVPVEVQFAQSPFGVVSSHDRGTISLANFSQGQQIVLAICSSINCSTRVVYSAVAWRGKG